MNEAKKGAKTSKKKAANKSGGNNTGASGNNAGNAIIGNIGLHYTCMRLSAMDLNAIPTARNAVGVDVLVNNRDFTGKTVSVQVKTVSGRHSVLLGKQGKPILGDFWVVVADANKIRIGEDPLCFIIEANKVKKGGTGAKNFRYLPLTGFDNLDFVDAWEKIASAIDPISAPQQAMKKRAKCAVMDIFNQNDDESSVFARSRDALLIHFVYVEGKTFREVHGMKAGEIARMRVPMHIKNAAKNVQRRRNSHLVSQNNGKPYGRWEVLAGMGSRLKRRWIEG